MAKKSRALDPDVPSFASAGTKTSDIHVKISYRIIQLFSEGLYSSPNKAIEELVSNAFDAGAENVHVLISADLGDESSTIVVIDDGEGMDVEGLANHWIIGESTKRDRGLKLPKGRKQIGKFGIGKLATYVLAKRLSHISKVGSKYYATSMDYTAIPSHAGGGAGTLDEKVPLPVRSLTKAQAEELLEPWITGDKEGYAALRLFGKGASKSWTVAIMSNLKDMAQEIRIGRLSWVLSTAMPLRSDFSLFLNGNPVKSSKIKGKTIGRWQIGKKLKKIPKPASDDLEVTEDATEPTDSTPRFGLTHAELGRVTGSLELYEDLLTQGKAAELGRSHGFFVYVRGRLVNADDEYFGISSNKLKHGTFSRFRFEVHIDRVDEELRSSRESVRETSLVETARNLLVGVFNFARRKHEEHEENEAAGRRATQRVADSPANLARTPLRNLVARALDGKASPKFVRCPDDLPAKEQQAFLDILEEKAESPEGLIDQIIQSPLGQHCGIAVYDAKSRILEINSLHPFVAYFGDEFSNTKQNLPLELLATSEVLLEASMYEMGVKESRIRDVMGKRDSLLRELARSTGKRNALMISQDIQDASSDQNALEEEVVAGFDSMGFAAVPIGGRGKRDGLAQAHLAGARKTTKSYSVSIEARAKLKPGKVATAATIGVSKVVKQRDDKDMPCDHAIVVAMDFPKDKRQVDSIRAQLDDDHKNTGKFITFISILDFARLVRLTPAKRLGLPKLKEFFEGCRFPEESKTWIDNIAASSPSNAPYREILEAIAEEQKASPGRTVEYSQIETHLRVGDGIVIVREEIASLCGALYRIVPEYVYAGESGVEITSRPDRILDTFNATIKEYPEEQKTVKKKPKNGK